ncbi:glucose-inhibited division protein B [Aggregatibacter actinomycetemcomitans serotype e str. SC1083]|uniref:Ribosomal RNA small subunit methyltransferase G n=2 Tax=Aggregatibacter actinomycetemcomitans TaxID=714 RepID=G4A9I9_AGGAC|nr:16S rRNA (guanine(527)-N(7))-methyltransferase RsmG [Aggregatibacter actinomycetemcomitans]EGY33387.1 glucose-inhibited division protein B [Aggregatibacter actinomycetemcomitans serotype e str. SC1083]KYK73847.1 16S rRNA methyltransferase [Aggregatibacter actinomycetemcomitans serotype e str. SA3096]KYK82341.1 16S rRNA methyltransferase [Aggregatibacter actinomycetemcomitans serotype e str. SC936]TYB21123.1 16S rRNA (guanine(527)-N(7))-methyltransferase RsmG [Aggregatibacter actinomycetemcom
MKAKLDSLLAQAKIQPSDQQKQQLIDLVNLLNKWNKAYNLTSVRDPQDMLVKHILDSLVVSPYLQGDRFIDVGTGPGLPGLPLAIINPDKRFVLLDSLGKRISFIRNAVRELGLTNVTPVLSRVEEYQPEEKFDSVLSRAFASLKDMTEWCRHLPKSDGMFYALKGIYQQEEVQNLSDQFQIENVIPLEVPTLIGERHLILLTKK